MIEVFANVFTVFIGIVVALVVVILAFAVIAVMIKLCVDFIRKDN